MFPEQIFPFFGNVIFFGQTDFSYQKAAIKININQIIDQREAFWTYFRVCCIFFILFQHITQHIFITEINMHTHMPLY